MNIHKQTPEQVQAFEEFAAFIRMYAGPLFEEAAALGNLDPDNLRVIEETWGKSKNTGIRINIDLVDWDDDDQKIKPLRFQ